MTYTLLRKYENMNGDWSVSVEKGEYTLSFIFPSEPTDEMIDEIEEEITLDEEELSEYQQKRFGPRGDLIIQKQQLIQPIQDQIFNAIRELAESKNYDFIFDKSADIVML